MATASYGLVTSIAYAEQPVTEKKEDGVMANLCGNVFAIGKYYRGRVDRYYRGEVSPRSAYYEMTIRHCDQWARGGYLVYDWKSFVGNKESEDTTKTGKPKKLYFDIVGNQFVHFVEPGWGELTKFVLEPQSDGTVKLIFHYEHPGVNPWENSGYLRPSN
jgi:hypothetical protein